MDWLAEISGSTLEASSVFTTMCCTNGRVLLYVTFTEVPIFENEKEESSDPERGAEGAECEALQAPRGEGVWGSVVNRS